MPEVQCLVEMEGQVGRTGSANIVKGCGAVWETKWEGGRGRERSGTSEGIEEEWSTNDECTQGHTSTAVPPPPVKHSVLVRAHRNSWVARWEEKTK